MIKDPRWMFQPCELLGENQVLSLIIPIAGQCKRLGFSTFYSVKLHHQLQTRVITQLSASVEEFLDRTQSRGQKKKKKKNDIPFLFNVGLHAEVCFISCIILLFYLYITHLDAVVSESAQCRSCSLRR